MNQLNLPEDLYEFLKNGEELKFDQSKLEMEYVVLNGLDDLKLEIAHVYPTDDVGDPNEDNNDNGRYHVPVVSLIKECGYSSPFGLLAWVPDEKSFGTYDEEHDEIFLFEGATWSDIVKEPLKFLNNGDLDNESRSLKPIDRIWERYVWMTEAEYWAQNGSTDTANS